MPVAILSAVTDGHPERSARHRTLHRPNGLAGEMRAVFTTGSSCWGVVCLARSGEDPEAGDVTVFAIPACPNEMGQVIVI
jgi:hypothetical protein